MIATFITLFLRPEGWHRIGLAHEEAFGAGTALSVFGLVFVVTRLAFVGRIDRGGGVAVTGVSLCVEIAGLLLWRARPCSRCWDAR